MYRRICPQCGQILPARDYRRRPNLDNPLEYLAPPTTAVGGVIPNPTEGGAQDSGPQVRTSCAVPQGRRR
jgi:hypothetical protein